MSETIWDAYDDLAASLNEALLLLQDLHDGLCDMPGEDANAMAIKADEFLRQFSRRVRK
jgi:hypothetical protein